MSDIIPISGGPGTGKTTRLMDYVKFEHQDQSVPLEDILVVSFTRSQRDDIRRRCKGIFTTATSEELDRHIKTFHAAALYACTLGDYSIQDTTGSSLN